MGNLCVKPQEQEIDLREEHRLARRVVNNQVANQEQSKMNLLNMSYAKKREKASVNPECYKMLS